MGEGTLFGLSRRLVLQHEGQIQTLALAVGGPSVSNPYIVAIGTENCHRHNYNDVKEVLFRIEPIWVSI